MRNAAIPAIWIQVRLLPRTPVIRLPITRTGPGFQRAVIASNSASVRRYAT